MSFAQDKKARIQQYLLEKIDQGQTSIAQKTAEVFDTTPATIHKYLNALETGGVIRRVKRGTYVLTEQTRQFTLYRSQGQLTNEQRIYHEYILPELQAFPPNVREIWNYISSEMINNVIDHSGAEQLRIFLTSNALYTSLLLRDDGVGIFHKIQQYFGFETPREAVEELFKGKLTTDAQHHSGEGIFFSSRMADVFIILSSGLFYSHDRFSDDLLLSIHAVDTDPSARGTAVYIRLSNRSGKQAKDIFDAFADVKGGFTRTQLPLRQFFEDAPVSRSQAKRLCNRLERFQKVELDFEGISWMGQGFAHELFVVYAREHPEIALIPIHMGEDVQRMYRHVTENHP